MKKVKNSILAEGEVTGHAHLLVNDTEIYEDENGVKEFELSEPTDLVHEEHKTIKLPDSIAFQSDIIQEFDFFENEARKVQD